MHCSLNMRAENHSTKVHVEQHPKRPKLHALLIIQPNLSRGTHIHSVKFLSFVNSSNNSCKSPSEILCCRLGISDLASSALSQHKLPFHYQPTATHNNSKARHTQLRPLEHLQLSMRVQQPLHSLDVLLVLEPRKYLEVIQRLGKIPIHCHPLALCLYGRTVTVERVTGKQRNILRFLVFLPPAALILQHLVNDEPCFGQREGMCVLIGAEFES